MYGCTRILPQDFSKLHVFVWAIVVLYSFNLLYFLLFPPKFPYTNLFSYFNLTLLCAKLKSVLRVEFESHSGCLLSALLTLFSAMQTKTASHMSEQLADCYRLGQHIEWPHKGPADIYAIYCVCLGRKFARNLFSDERLLSCKRACIRSCLPKMRLIYCYFMLMKCVT